MAPKRRRTAKPKEPAYDWTEERTYAFLNLVVNVQLRNGHEHPFSWVQMSAEFKETYKITAPASTMKNKYRNMWKKYLLWNKLINGETGLSWDSVKRTIAAPAEWWNRKIEVPLALM